MISYFSWKLIFFYLDYTSGSYYSLQNKDCDKMFNDKVPGLGLATLNIFVFIILMLNNCWF